MKDDIIRKHQAKCLHQLQLKHFPCLPTPTSPNLNKEKSKNNKEKIKPPQTAVGRHVNCKTVKL